MAYALRAAAGQSPAATKPALRGDNGSTLKATTVLAMLNWLGVKPSYSRPRVSDDNAFRNRLIRHRHVRDPGNEPGFYAAAGTVAVSAMIAWHFENMPPPPGE